MPVLEAMAAGLPVACSDIAPLREVAGDEALFFDPLNESAIGNALDRIVLGPALNGRERAHAFTWERCAQETLQVLGGVRCSLA
jgi:glycosyltransferase involved in cell wall biosynthesis